MIFFNFHGFNEELSCQPRTTEEDEPRISMVETAQDSAEFWDSDSFQQAVKIVLRHI